MTLLEKYDSLETNHFNSSVMFSSFTNARIIGLNDSPRVSCSMNVIQVIFSLGPGCN